MKILGLGVPEMLIMPMLLVRRIRSAHRGVGEARRSQQPLPDMSASARARLPTSVFRSLTTCINAARHHRRI